MKKKTIYMNLIQPIIVGFLVFSLVFGGAVTGICAQAAESAESVESVESPDPADSVESAESVSLKNTEKFHNAYLYRLDDGQLKYWLDLSGDDLQLHCFFRSGDPEFYETVYTLVPDEAASSRNTVVIGSVMDNYSMDISSRFLFMGITFADDTATLSVVRDENTLAGGAEDNLLTGSYEMKAGKPAAPAQAVGNSPATGTYDDYLHFAGSSFHENDGRLKYWIEFHNDFELHCLFSSGDPSTGASYEEVYTLYPDFDNSEAQTLWINSVLDGNGNDISDSFKAFLFQFSSDDSVIMEVSRDESKLAGGESNNLIDGSYMMKKGAALETVRGLLPDANSAAEQATSGQDDSASSENKKNMDQLCAMAQEYYNRHYNYFPPEASCAENEDGTYSIHLFEIVNDGNGFSHSSTSAWYTVDANGIGTDDISGNAIDLSN